MSYLFTSQRLGFRTWIEQDLEPFARLNADKEVMEFFPGTRSFEESKTFVERFSVYFLQNGYGPYVVETRHNREFIGFIGFMTPRFEAWFTPCTEIGWRLKREAWGCGYATEGARRVLEHGFNKFHFKEVYSFTSVHNTRSEKVMQKCGMTSIGHFQHPLIDDGHPLKEHVLYRLENGSPGL